MRITMKVDDFKIHPNGMVEIMVGVEWFYWMLDRVKPGIIADYIGKRITEARKIRTGMVEENIVKAGALERWINEKKAAGAWDPEEEVTGYED